MPTSARPYKNAQRKDMTSQDPFRKPQSMVLHQTIEGERKERMKAWITFFRRNPHRFIESYFGIRLYPFQILMIWVLQRSNLAYIVASRAASKTFIIAIWAMTLCVLYPGIKVVACSRTMKQGALIIGKIDELRNKYPNVAREIRALTNNPNDAKIIFQDGSTIIVVPSSESARGKNFICKKILVLH